MNDYHIPVLKDKVIEYLNPQEGKVFLDCTFGGGGHSQALLEAGASVFALDQDQDAIKHAQPLLEKYRNLHLIKANFGYLDQVIAKEALPQFDGILFDVGVSSRQLDNSSRGFSFMEDAPLDMRMDRDMGVTAADLLAALGEKELITIFSRYGDEPQAKKIAKTIVSSRKNKLITTTKELATLIERIKPRHGKLHPATKIFQALRIAVNDELHALQDALPVAVNQLKTHGLLIVISFHEGEDRIVKQYFKNQSDMAVIELITQKPITPDHNEIQNNIRARSAKMRVARKI